MIDNSSSKLAAICNLNEDLLCKISEELGVQCTFTDYEKLLGQDDVDMVFIATRDAGQRPMTVAALDARKHVLVEKPTATTVEEYKQMPQAQEKGGSKLAVNPGAADQPAADGGQAHGRLRLPR